MRRPETAAIALKQTHRDKFARWSGMLFGAVAALGFATQVFAQDSTIVASSFSDFGEVKYADGFEQLDYVNVDAPKGGEISIPANGTFDSMNPYSRKGRGGRLSTLSIERLMTSTSDDPYGSYCLICETLEYPESQDWVIFTIREDAKFSDGTPVTAQDVVFTVKTFLTDGLPSFAQAVSKLYASYEALDDRRVKFTFTEGIPRNGLIGQAGASPVFSQAWFEKNNYSIKEPSSVPIMGTGPYAAVEIDPPRRIVYERNEDYWGEDLPINRGQNNFDRIRVEYFADDTAALEAFKSGVYTFRQETSSLKWATAYDFPGINNGNIVKKELPNGNLASATGFVFNLRRDKFDDIRVREALQLMYNFTWTNETLQYGLFAQRSSFWENSDLAATGVAEGQELEYLKQVEDLLEDKSVLTEPVVEAHESSARQLDRRNLRKALALLEEAGFTTNDAGMLVKDGKTLDIEFLTGQPVYDRLIQPYVENLKRLGINAKYERVDPAQYTNRERAFDWDIIFDGYRNGLEEGQGLMQRFGSADAEYSLFNPAGYSSPAVDKLGEILLGTETLDEMKGIVRAVDRILRANRFMVPVWFNDTFWVAYYDQYEHPENLPPYALGQLDFWWYNAEKAEALKAKGAL